MFADLNRTDAWFTVEYRPLDCAMTWAPYEDVCGEHPQSISVLDEAIEVAAPLHGDDAVKEIERQAGQLGLLDATRVRIAEGAAVDAVVEFRASQLRNLLVPAMAYRQMDAQALMESIAADPHLRRHFDHIVGLLGCDVFPDAIPDIAAIGIAMWCWRNGTAVEEHHLPGDVLMARVNIAVTQAILPHIDPFEGIDWKAIQHDLTGSGLQLPDGQPVLKLFGTGWTAVKSSVQEQLEEWGRVDMDILGPDTTLRLMTIAGSTSFTSSWWGQGRWRSICTRIVEDAVAGGLALPQPFNFQGAPALIEALQQPHLQSDDVLRWFIDMPDGNAGGPLGLRYHHVTQPIVHTYDPWWAESDIEE
ncbi:hypothetical protein EBN03_11965 [Nocardia stercoris]|uniref:Uncharacterized protein n=1 Tax=Nocardia stercoris TaxID=2483361 RepID=A0A3M2L6Q7_9NOCA|nr:hypothetical protein EBN03_11965 [Nocardia stercoris]